jgi:hypothetical protein
MGETTAHELEEKAERRRAGGLLQGLAVTLELRVECRKCGAHTKLGLSRESAERLRAMRAGAPQSTTVDPKHVRKKFLERAFAKELPADCEETKLLQTVEKVHDL